MEALACGVRGSEAFFRASATTRVIGFMSSDPVVALQLEVARLQEVVKALQVTGPKARPCTTVKLDDHPLDPAAILGNEVSVGPEPEWFNRLFPTGQCAFRFPYGAEKNGRLPAGSDETGSLLQAKAVSDPLFRAFSHEWQTLYPAIVYQLLQAQVTTQLLDCCDVLAEDQHLKALFSRTTLAQRLVQLEKIQVTVLEELQRRASVILTALYRDVPTANRLHSQFYARQLASLHPDAVEVFKEKLDRPTYQAKTNPPANRRKGKGAGTGAKSDTGRASAE